MLPVDTVCYASTADICKAIAPFVRRDFSDLPTAAARTFAVVYEHRASDGLKLDRAELVAALAALVPQRHTVNLGCPELVIMVRVWWTGKTRH